MLVLNADARECVSFGPTEGSKVLSTSAPVDFLLNRLKTLAIKISRILQAISRFSLSLYQQAKQYFANVHADSFDLSRPPRPIGQKMPQPAASLYN